MAHERVETVLRGKLISTRAYKRDGIIGSLAIFQHRKGFYSAHWDQEASGASQGYLNIRTDTSEKAQIQAIEAMSLQAWHLTSDWVQVAS
jgi:hypothetical protein